MSKKLQLPIRPKIKLKLKFPTIPSETSESVTSKEYSEPLPGVQHYKKFIPAHDTLMEYMKTIPWKTVTWGRTNRPLPRKIYQANYPLDPNIEPLYPFIAKIQEQDNVIIDGIWCNHYRNGSDHTPYHKDSYKATVYCICLGATRTVNFKSDSNGTVTPIETQSGDMYVFTPEVDKRYKHSVPKRAGAGERISIVLFGHTDTH